MSTLIPARNRRTVTVAGTCLLVFVFILFLAAPTFVIPLGTDQNYFVLGARTLLDGERLYADLWDIKPPAIYMLYTVPVGLFGESTEAVRAFDLLNTVIVTAAVYLLGRRYFGERAGVLAGLAYSFYYLVAASTDGLAQTESFMAAPLVLAFVVYRTWDAESRPWLRPLCAGLLLGLAIAIKVSAVLFAFGLVAQELVLRDEAWTYGAALRRLVWAAAGVVAVQAAWLGFLLATGALDAFLNIESEFTAPYQAYRWSPGNVPYRRTVLDATAGWLRYAAVLTLPAWAGLMLATLRGLRREAIFFAVLAGLGMLTVWWQGKFFSYHWLVMVPLLAPPAGFAFALAIDFVRARPAAERWPALGLLLAAVVVAGFSFMLTVRDGYDQLIDRLQGDLTSRDTEALYITELPLLRQMTDYVDSQGGTEDSLYVWGFWTLPYIAVDRPLPTRFVTNAALRATWTPESWRNELLDDLDRNRPRFIAVAAGDDQPWLTGTLETSDQAFCDSFPELRAFVEANYQPVLNNGLFALYDRDAAQAQAPGRCG